ncbi:MAG TPA: hypothetical protein PKY82_13420 [Pyrinomonadaceae bacterium]|nr:hypothetical protein [Pyrinomonadaceae bacterium]
MNIKMIGIFIGLSGLGLFIWHVVKVITNQDYDGQGFGAHHWLSLIGGLSVLLGTAIYIIGRERTNRKT